jgi:hypothetical protein
MPMKGHGTGQLREIDRWDGGGGWIAYPDEEMQRASHALIVNSDVWVTDPVDAPGVDELLESMGEVAGVVVCLDRHKRDAAAVARRHDVPVYIPDWMTGVASELDAPTKRFGRELADTGYRALTVVNRSLPPWQEVALYHDETGTLVVPEALGTASFFRAPGEQLGVHPMLRPTPPRRPFRGIEPERVLVGHGEGVFDNAAIHLSDALDNARSRLPAAYLEMLRNML